MRVDSISRSKQSRLRIKIRWKILLLGIQERKMSPSGSRRD